MRPNYEEKRPNYQNVRLLESVGLYQFFKRRFILENNRKFGI
jgi:hypothetical protein